MNSSELVPSLALMTLLLVLAIAVGGFMMFKRKRANRHPMEQRKDGVIARVRDDPR